MFCCNLIELSTKDFMDKVVQYIAERNLVSSQRAIDLLNELGFYKELGSHLTVRVYINKHAMEGYNIEYNIKEDSNTVPEYANFDINIAKPVSIITMSEHLDSIMLDLDYDTYNRLELVSKWIEKWYPRLKPYHKYEENDSLISVDVIDIITNNVYTVYTSG